MEQRDAFGVNSHGVPCRVGDVDYAVVTVDVPARREDESESNNRVHSYDDTRKGDTLKMNVSPGRVANRFTGREQPTSANA